jgi:hypothetical protein
VIRQRLTTLGIQPREQRVSVQPPTSETERAKAS